MNAPKQSLYDALFLLREDMALAVHSRPVHPYYTAHLDELLKLHKPSAEAQAKLADVQAKLDALRAAVVKHLIDNLEHAVEAFEGEEALRRVNSIADWKIAQALKATQPTSAMPTHHARIPVSAYIDEKDEHIEAVGSGQE